MTTEFCTQCGEKLASGARFCRACGAEATPSAAWGQGQPKAKRRPPAKRSGAPMPMMLLAIAAIVLLAGGVLLLANLNNSGSFGIQGVDRQLSNK